MNLDPLFLAELLALGLCSGFLAGLLGIGGGMVMVPFLTWMLSQRGVSADVTPELGQLAGKGGKRHARRTSG